MSEPKADHWIVRRVGTETYINRNGAWGPVRKARVFNSREEARDFITSDVDRDYVLEGVTLMPLPLEAEAPSS